LDTYAASRRIVRPAGANSPSSITVSWEPSRFALIKAPSKAGDAARLELSISE
jgi:hypothetical protein